MATIVFPGYEPLFLAQEQGFFGSGRISLVTYPSIQDSLRAFRNGSIDVAATTGDELLLLAGDHQDVSAIAVLDWSNGIDCILARPPIASMAELKGRRVAFEPNAVGALMLAMGLEAAGLGPSDVQAVPRSMGDFERMLVSGEVDAVVTFEPLRSRILGRGAREIFDSRRVPHRIFDALVARAGLLRTRREALATLVSGWRKGLSYLTHHRAAALRRSAEREGLTPAELERALELLEIPGPEEERRLLSPDGGGLREALDALADLMRRTRLLDRAVDVSGLVDGSLAP